MELLISVALDEDMLTALEKENGQKMYIFDVPVETDVPLQSDMTEGS